jgi:hypothetical protein
VSKLVAGELKRQAKDGCGVALTPEFGDDDVANVAADSEENVVEPSTSR